MNGKGHFRMFAVLVGMTSTLAQGAWVADASYGTNGIRELQGFPNAVQSLVASAGYADGRIVAVGSIESFGQRDLLVVRFGANGELDPSFGFGGIAQIDLGGSVDEGLAVALLADGHIIVAGGRNNGPLLLELDAQGAVDAAFGHNGFLSFTLLGGSAGRLGKVTIDAQGRIVAAGSFTTGGSADAAAYPYAIRASADGRLDASFDNDGVRVLREMPASMGGLVIDAAGRTVVVGSLGAEYRLAALDSNGALVGSFGTAGIATAAVGVPALASEILALGGDYYVSGLNGAALAKFDAAGNLDASFGTNGIAAAPMPIGVWALGALADGRIAVAGHCSVNGNQGAMVGSFSAAGAWEPIVCERIDTIGAFAEVRSLVVRNAELRGVGIRFDAGAVNAEMVRVVKAPEPVKVDKRCKKAKFARKHVGTCRG